ncbi:hypothetical protein J6590_057683 [Homalodisca vitripennis]|nr:hypothetical protein J6590_057683 [Homalodisca vitripennis]
MEFKTLLLQDKEQVFSSFLLPSSTERILPENANSKVRRHPWGKGYCSSSNRMQSPPPHMFSVYPLQDIPKAFAPQVGQGISSFVSRNPLMTRNPTLTLLFLPRVRGLLELKTTKLDHDEERTGSMGQSVVKTPGAIDTRSIHLRRIVRRVLVRKKYCLCMIKEQLGVPMVEQSKTLDFRSELEIAQIQILSVTEALFISTIDLVLY